MNRYAILISCEDYTEYPNISFCHADAILMQETLAKYCDYEYDKISTLTLFQGGEFNNPNDILSKLGEIVNKSEDGDTILFYFAGHGLLDNDHDITDDNDAYLLLPDTKDSDLKNTALSLKKLNACLSENNRCNFRIFDACHSGFDARGTNQNSFNDFALKDGWITLAACAKNENSYPDTNLEQGIFTYCLSESIKEFNKNELIYVEALKIKICDKVEKWCADHNKKQTPTMNASVSGNMPIAQRLEYETDLPTITEPNCNKLANKGDNKGDDFMDEILVPQVNPNEILNTSSNHKLVLWESPSGITLPKKADVQTILSYNTQLKKREVQQISSTYNSDYYEMTAEFIWTRAMNLLRKKVLSLGTEFVSDMIEITNPLYVVNLPPFETINLAFELGFIDKLGRVRLKNTSDIIQEYSLPETEEEMTEDQVKEIIRVCIQYVLGQDDSNLNLEYNNFRDKLKLESIEDQQLETILNSPYFYKKTTTRTLMNLLKQTDGGEFANVSSNMITIIPYIWNTLLSEEKYFIASNYAKYANDGNDKCTNVLKSVLMKVQGFDYVPENLKSLTFIEMAKTLISIHYGLNNFYNEPKAVKELYSLGTIIPKPALEVVINATLLVKLGNAYGSSIAAQDDADKILDSIRQEQWKYYLNSLLSSSEYVLSKISCNDRRTLQWFSIVTKYKLNEFEISNPQIKNLLDKSAIEDRPNTSLIASKLYNKLMNY